MKGDEKVDESGERFECICSASVKLSASELESYSRHCLLKNRSTQTLGRQVRDHGVERLDRLVY